MKIIDIHTHAFPDELAGRAIAHLEEGTGGWKAVLDGRVSSLLSSMDQAGVETSVVCPIATKPAQVEGIFKWCQAIRSPRIAPFPSVHPDGADAGDWLRRFAADGFRGIKLHPMYQQFAIDDERALAVYRVAADVGLAVLIHCGRDIAFPPDDDRAAPVRIRRALSAVPGLKLIATHMGGWRMWDEVRRELADAPCLIETAFSFHEMSAPQALDLIRFLGADRVMFGTDSPWTGQSDEIARIRGLGLTEGELTSIFWSNAAAILGL
jgi:predicted TIM-barrel fold metal-dependent hydrolase